MGSEQVWEAVRCAECQANLLASHGSNFCLPTDVQAWEARATTGNGMLLGCGYQYGCRGTQGHAS